MTTPTTRNALDAIDDNIVMINGLPHDTATCNKFIPLAEHLKQTSDITLLAVDV